MLEISTFGGLSIKHGGKPTSMLATLEAEALLVYLASTGMPVPLQALAELLWPGRSSELALSDLHEALASLHRLLGTPIPTPGDTAHMSKGMSVWLDLRELEEKLDEGQTEEAIALYAGPFLEGFELRGAPAFNAWVVEERQRLHRGVVDALQILVAQQLAGGDLRGAITSAGRLLDLEPALESTEWHSRLSEALNRDDARPYGRHLPAAENSGSQAKRGPVEAGREVLLPVVDARARRQAALLRLSAELAAALDEDEVCRQVVLGLHDTLGYDVLALMLIDEATGDRVLAAQIGYDEPLTPIRPGQGLSEQPLLDGQLQYTPVVTRAPNYTYGKGGSEVDVPVRVGDRVLGVLVAESRQTHAFNQDDFEVLTAAAQQAGLAIEKARLLAGERQRADELDALRTTIAEITSELELPALLQAIVERAASLLNVTGGELGLYDETSQELNIVVSYNLGKDYVGTRHALGEGAMGRVAETGEPLIITDYDTWERGLPEYPNIHATLAAPLHARGKLLGVFTTASTDPTRQFTPADLHLLNLFAQQAAIAVSNAWLYDQAQQEITERVRVEDELRRYQEHLEELAEERAANLLESEKRYRTLFDGVPVGLYRTTPEGRIVEANLAQVKMLGYPDRKALMATSSADLYMDPEERVRWQTLMEQEGVVREFETQFRRQDGTIIWVKDTAQAFRDKHGRVLYYEGSLEDITERKRAEAKLRQYQEGLEELVQERTAELRESEARYRTLFDGVPVGLYRSTPDGKAMDVNLAMAQMLGYQERADALLELDAANLYVDPADRRRWQELMEREGIVRDFEAQLYRRDGIIIWVNDTARAVKGAQDEVLYYEGSLEEVTERKRFEEEIRRQKEYYEALFVNNPVAVITADLNGDIVSWNPMAEKLFQYSQEEVVGRNLEDVVANDASIHGEAVLYRNVVFDEGRIQVSTRRTRKDGSLLDVELLALPVVVAGEQVGYIAIYHDISERLAFEEEIRRQKEYYEALFVNSPVAVVTANLDGNIVSWNPMAEKLFQYAQEEVIGSHLDDVIADDALRAEAVGYTNQVIQVGRVQATVRRIRKDGSLVDVDLLALPVIVAGEKVGFIAIYHDISERKAMERELRRQKEYYEALFVNNPGAVITVDLEGSVISWNPASERLFGYQQQEVIGQNLDALVAKDPRILEEAKAYTEQVSTTGRIQATARRTRKDGSLVDVEVLALPVIVGQEKVGYIGIYIDITDLQEARRQAEAASRAKSEFLANMSHELRTPLNAILGYTQLMDRDTSLSGDQLEYLGIIDRSGEHLLALINDVLEMSKIEAGKMRLQERSFDLYHQLDGLEEVFGLRARRKGLRLVFTRGENIPRYIVTDEGKLGQVLNNLLGNAVKFTQEGHVHLRLTAEPLQPEMVTLHFEVEDTGPGISPEELPGIFEAFYQSETGRDAGEGTGLGLTISRQFVNLMGGDIVVTSQPGRGSSFRFEVQVGLARAEATDTWVTHPIRRVIGIESSEPTYRLLIAEDSETNRELLVKLLAPIGFEIRETVNGLEAIQVWERWRPHLIWMDMRMPIMDGYEATRRIKATADGQATIVIALTASAFEEDREKILAAGCDDFMRKPFREDELLSLLAKHLGVRYVYEDVEPPPLSRALDHTVRPDGDAELAGRLAALPGEWLADMQRAAILGDLRLMLQLIEQIREQDSDLVEGLAALIHDFEHERILMLIENVGVGP
ncbi:MAG: PAS domain S-box protein [Anaerolineae bacterium]|jgi:PAS domain S-box-containing protein